MSCILVFLLFSDYKNSDNPFQSFFFVSVSKQQQQRIGLFALCSSHTPNTFLRFRFKEKFYQVSSSVFEMVYLRVKKGFVLNISTTASRWLADTNENYLAGIVKIIIPRSRDFTSYIILGNTNSIVVYLEGATGLFSKNHIGCSKSNTIKTNVVELR